MIDVLLLVVGFILLIKCGDWFVAGSCKLAKIMRIPEVVIGATIVTIGSTLPECITSVLSASKGLSSISFGNAIGSMTCNICLILAITMLCVPSIIDTKPLKLVAVYAGISLAAYYIAAYTGSFNRLVGIALVVILLSYLYKTVKIAMSNNTETSEVEKPENKEIIKMVLSIFVGAAGIAVGANLLISSCTAIAKMLLLSEQVVAITVVALGTSLPELVVAIQSIKQKSVALSVGNIMGTVIFNICMTSGLSILTNPFDVPCSKTIIGMNASLVVDLPILLAAFIIAFVPVLITGKTRRWQGALLLFTYVSYMAYQIIF